MTQRDFVYWLQGYFEMLDPSGTAPMPLGIEQVRVLRQHLQLVFKHEAAPPQKVQFVPPYHDEGLRQLDWQRKLQEMGTTATFTGAWPETVAVC